MNGDALPTIDQNTTTSFPQLGQRLATLIDGGASPTPSTARYAHAASVDQYRVVRDYWTPQERIDFSKWLLNDVAIVSAQHPGVTRSRVRSLLPDHRKAQVDAVLQWLDAAEVLAPPITPDAPFRHPRALICTTAAAITECLAATPFLAAAGEAP